jgi:hypothetical protein
MADRDDYDEEEYDEEYDDGEEYGEEYDDSEEYGGEEEPPLPTIPNEGKSHIIRCCY